MKIFSRLKGIIQSKGKPQAAATVEPSSGERPEAREHRPSQLRDKKGNRPRRRGKGRHPPRSRDTELSDQASRQASDSGEKKKSERESRPKQGRKRQSQRERFAAARRGKIAPEARAGGPGGKGRKRKSRKDLGGKIQRIEFPELLPLDESSEEFRNNEFRPLGLSDKIVMVLATNRFRTPTDIQKAFIPVALRGVDLLGQAKTGTGKTVAFLMPIFDRLDKSSGSVQALIVVPTRELCRQVSWEAMRFGRSLDFKVLSLYGGTSVSREIERLKKGPQIVVGTPGRLLDHIFNHNLDLTGLKILVLDEADRMFDIGFRQDIIKIIKACPQERQLMLLSATLDKEVEDLSKHYMKNPVPLYLSRDEITVESIWQRYIPVHRHDKLKILAHLLENQKPTQSIIFTNTKKMSDSVALRLSRLGFKARCIHSDLSQNRRERIMDDFRTGKIEHLVATDVAARGLDITGISHVINYDIPENPEDYVHRVGRTGRMGAAGKAFTFVSSNEGKQLTGVEKLINKLIAEWEEL